MTLSLVAVSRQKRRARVSKWFYVINSDVRKSGQANDSASIAKRTKKRNFAIAKCWRKRCRRPNGNAAITKRV